jgi:hypothetical protein
MDLSLADTQELLGEIMKRFDAALFTGYRDMSDKQYHIATLTKGNTLEVIGLSRYTMEHVESSLWDEEDE